MKHTSEITKAVIDEISATLAGVSHQQAAALVDEMEQASTSLSRVRAGPG